VPAQIIFTGDCSHDKLATGHSNKCLNQTSRINIVIRKNYYIKSTGTKKIIEHQANKLSEFLKFKNVMNYTAFKKKPSNRMKRIKA